MRIGVIGTKWGLMHVGAFRAAGAEVVALCGQHEAHTREVADREGIVLATADVRELCAAVDAVVVASPDALHRAHVEAALDAGCAVLCEKPLALTHEDAAALVERARHAKRPCVVNFPYRMLPPLRALRAWLREHRAHHLVITVRNSFVPTKALEPGARVGRSADFGGVSHLLDAVLWLTGASPTWVQASLSGRPVHTAALQVGLSSGAVLVLTHAASPEPGLHGGWSLLGEDWEAGFSGGFIPAREGWCVSPVRCFESGAWWDLAPGLEPLPGEREPWAQAHVETARRFLGMLGQPPRVDAELASVEEAALVQRILSAALASEDGGRRILLD
ncbi:Gfo/Idh/MocA family oxidoreductase [Archangium violaceum]|uniref:Gfo/Idh/MocA family protein n=1 Tax=Archangium violaceum TaxID=83451 RepID=UPI002B2CF553|nr:Gfo/Idh/MocA family oxidoreductase [Archangium gephyra]